MKTFCLLLICLTFGSCLQEDLDPSDHEFRGNWDSSKYAIQIFSNGSATLDIRRRGRLEGHVKIKDDVMVFTSENEDDEIGYKRLHIDQRPAVDSNGVTYMIIEGHRLEKF